MASHGDDCYSSSEDYCFDDLNCSEEEEDEDYLSQTLDPHLQKYYTILKEEQIKQRQNNDITEISTVLSIPRKAATILLCSFKWTVSEVLDNWFANEDQVRKSVGLVFNDEKQDEILKVKLTCTICFARRRCKRCVWAGCGHSFCKNCYSNYIKVSIDNGIGCLLLHCPQPNCKVVIDQDLINSLKELPDEHKSKYENFLLRSYVEQSRTLKWCPGNGCKNAIEFIDTCQKNWDVVCDCSLEFCWNCGSEKHSPVDCEKVLEWLKKENNEAENVGWILANTKPCPKCKIPIEKNNGCEHMTCTRCGYQFCWLCLGDWHLSFACNAFWKGNNGEGNGTRKLGTSMLYRYAHYFERWKANKWSRRMARADLEKFRSVHKEKLFDTYYEKQSMRGIEEAWLQIIECRRVLRWSYVYGYYLYENENAKKNVRRKILFEDLQGQAESALSRLHECAEEDLQPFIGENVARLDEFSEYYCELVNLTRVTRNFFRNLVEGLQNGLELGDDDDDDDDDDSC